MRATSEPHPLVLGAGPSPWRTAASRGRCPEFRIIALGNDVSYDAYLVHASDNASAAQELVAALRSRGLIVWFNAFIVGPSIREQMEKGLRDSDFGIVLLSPEFFAKRWTQQELDALMGLEVPGEVRILPVWLHTTEEDVRNHSPMLAMRSAAVLGDAGVEGVADEIVKSILTLSGNKSPGTRLRLQIATGFRWTQGPVWLPQSIAEYDRTFSEDFALTDLSHYPETPRAPLGKPVPLMELLRAHTFWDGTRVTMIGQQVTGSVQVFDEIIGTEDLPPDPSRPTDASIAAYVFQLSSVEFQHGELVYVHCIGPYSRSEPGMGPYAPEAGWLCWVTGVLLSFGYMPNSSGEEVLAGYIAASSILFTPPTD